MSSRDAVFYGVVLVLLVLLVGTGITLGIHSGRDAEELADPFGAPRLRGATSRSGVALPDLLTRRESASARRARSQMDVLAVSVEMFYLDHRALPTSLERLTEETPRTGEPYVESIPDDPWGRPYELHRLGGRRFQILSVGEDGMQGTEDDVVWPQEWR